MPQYRKKPVVIDAMQFVVSNWKECEEFAGGAATPIGNWKHQNDVLCLQIKTLEGVMTAVPDDWIIRGVKGEIYPCKPDVFAASYDPI